MKKMGVGVVLLAFVLIALIWGGIWSLSFVEVSSSDAPVDIVESSESRPFVENTGKDMENSMESLTPDPSAQDDDFWEVSVIPPMIVDEKKVTWVFSEVATFFIEEEGGDPAYIVNWIFETVDKYGYELIIDVDPNIYLEQ